MIAGNNGGENGDFEREGEADLNLFQDGGAGPQGLAKIEGYHTPEPGEKLLVQRPIEPELGPELGQLARVDVAALVPTNNQQGHVPRDDVHEQEDH